ncbi:MAG: hypothetical protein V1834_00650 [Candidatus Micrarchaeota archaeon]
MRVVKIPVKRLSAFKKCMGRIAVEGGVELKVNDESNAVIDGEGGSEWIAEQVVRAIASGFDYRVASKMFNDEYYLEEVDLQLALNRNENSIKRYKARIIGTQGKAKKTIAELSGAFLSIYGDKVFILGKFEEVRLAKEAVIRLLEGREHAGVYYFLEKSNAKSDLIG